MFPSARLSLPSRTQKKLFAFSGSSVASGAKTSERTSGSTPIELGQVDHLHHEQVGAADHRAKAHYELERDHVAGGLVAGVASQDQGADRLRWLDLAAGVEGPPNVEAVGAHEADREHGIRIPWGAPRPSTAARAKKHEEDDQVALERRGMRGKPAAPVRGAADSRGGEANEHHRDRREQERGADDRADRDAFRAGLRLRSRRRSGSGSPASRFRPRRAGCPPLPRPRASRWPAHSTALVNSRAPARMTAKLASRRIAVPIRGAR